MGWKDWSYVKKGAVVGFCFAVIIYIAHLVLQYLIKDMTLDQLNDSVLFIISSILIDWPLILIMGPLSVCNLFGISICPIIIFILFFVIYALIGALIGYIIGKIKNRNKIK